MILQMLEPPPKYDHPYHGQVIEQRVSSLQMFFSCHGPTSACSWVNKKGVCYILIPNTERDGRVIALIRRHETGHCNGWPANHDGGHWVDVKSGKTVPPPKYGRSNFQLF
jgi:hypothetical protein